MTSSLGDQQIPDEFRQFAGFYYWEAEDGPITMDELTHQTVERATGKGRSVDALIGFLDTLLDGGATDADLQRIWYRAHPNWDVRYGFHRGFFTEIRDAALAIKLTRL